MRVFGTLVGVALLSLSVLLLGGCDNAPKQPKVSSRVKPEGAAKDIRAKDALPEPLPKETNDAERTTLRLPLAPGLVVPEFRQPTEQETAAMALGRIGQAAVPSLVQTLRHRDPEVRKQAALVIARIGPEAYDAVPELTDLLGDPDEDVRKSAARALGQIGPKAAEAVPALMRQLVEPKPAAPRR
jgi:HEAT repeat protein